MDAEVDDSVIHGTLLAVTKEEPIGSDSSIKSQLPSFCTDVPVPLFSNDELISMSIAELAQSLRVMPVDTPEFNKRKRRTLKLKMNRKIRDLNKRPQSIPHTLPAAKAVASIMKIFNDRPERLLDLSRAVAVGETEETPCVLCERDLPQHIRMHNHCIPVSLAAVRTFRGRSQRFLPSGKCRLFEGEQCINPYHYVLKKKKPPWGNVCVVSGCRNSTNRRSKDTSFFRLPCQEDQERYRAFLEFCGKAEFGRQMICSVHFRVDDVDRSGSKPRLLRTALPCHYPASTTRMPSAEQTAERTSLQGLTVQEKPGEEPALIPDVGLTGQEDEYESLATFWRELTDGLHDVLIVNCGWHVARRSDCEVVLGRFILGADLDMCEPRCSVIRLKMDLIPKFYGCSMRTSDGALERESEEFGVSSTAHLQELLNFPGGNVGRVSKMCPQDVMKHADVEDETCSAHENEFPAPAAETNESRRMPTKICSPAKRTRSNKPSNKRSAEKRVTKRTYLSTAEIMAMPSLLPASEDSGMEESVRSTNTEIGEDSSLLAALEDQLSCTDDTRINDTVADSKHIGSQKVPPQRRRQSVRKQFRDIYGTQAARRKPCLICGIQVSLVLEHMNLRHAEYVEMNWKFDCDQCSRRFPSEADRRNHVYRVHRVEIPLTSAAKESAINYIRATGQFSCGCEKCGVCFPVVGLLKLHRSQCDEEACTNLSERHCPACGFVGDTHTDLLSHIPQHNIPKGPQMPCLICGKYVTKLAVHVELHQEEMKVISEGWAFPCEECGKRFATEGRLTMHTSSHRVDRYQCLYCARQFASPTHFTKHVAEHTVDGRFGCPYCEKLFDRYRVLRAHFDYYHNARKCRRCELCGKVFGSSALLKQHTKSRCTSEDFREILCSVGKRPELG